MVGPLSSRINRWIDLNQAGAVQSGSERSWRSKTGNSFSLHRFHLIGWKECSPKSKLSHSSSIKSFLCCFLSENDGAKTVILVYQRASQRLDQISNATTGRRHNNRVDDDEKQPFSLMVCVYMCVWEFSLSLSPYFYLSLSLSLSFLCPPCRLTSS